MKQTILLLLATCTFATTWAQEPVWMDPISRASQWQESIYLTAFATEEIPKNGSQSDAQEKLYQMIKSQLSDGILVSINTKTELNISIENTATDERLQQRSTSVSDMDLVGLKLDNYYDKRKKSLYAFGYVSIDELTQYNKGIISKNSLQIQQNNQQYTSTSQKPEKIRLLINNKQLLESIQKSINVLNALSKPHGADIHQLKITASDNSQKLDQLFGSGTVTATDIVTRLHGELLLHLPTGSLPLVRASKFSYSSSTITSPYSDALNHQLKNALSEDKRITFSPEGKGQLVGRFFQNSTQTVFSATISAPNQDIISTTTFAVATDLIDTQGLALLPTHFEVIPNLSNIQLSAPKRLAIKPAEYVSHPLTVSCSLDGKLMPNVPIDIILEKSGKQKIYQITTSSMGQAHFNLDNSMVVPGETYLAKIALNLGQYLSLSPQNSFLKEVQSNQKTPETSTELVIKSPTVYVQSSEVGISSPLRIKVIEPAIKSGLSDLHYSFVNDDASSDYDLIIEAIARKGQTGEIATLAYIDATVSLIDKLTGKEIYKNSFFDIKGIGATHDDAQAKAFQRAKTQIVDDITYNLEYKR
ncbi:hypothetical protein SAMN04488028_104370 [Reichenbachiella agariperforans]|uniref:LPP20 lipoprotein n=1 Tax=Reichenbachiella agariperforans TaxID=156994 RepID=A0A1M6S1W9_REIAG|nr:hypothetical protein [Reichenbachiella agariperforans]SHK38651.1 hypothetical protein SAMN04488028_104370 [Reichenbachiella agariperforans]